MKENLSRMLRSGVAMLLVLCMVAGFVPTAVFAAEVKDGNGDGIINYVSFGASNVNGFGVEGYISLPGSIEEIMNNPDLIKDMNVFGYQRMPKDSYPYMVAAALNEAAGGTVAGSYNGDATKDPFSKVKVDQMGISSMRMEELGYLLDTFDGDSYTDWRFADIDGDGDGDNWFDKAYGGSLEALKAEYVRAITEADVITMDMGMNNFGVYISHQVGNPAYGETLEDIDPELAADFAKAKAHVKNLVTQYSSEAALLLDGMDSLIDALAYAVVGYCHNFDKVMEKIYELNPDVNVVVVSIQNLMTGMSLELPGIGELPLGDIFGAVINIANLHTATGSPYCDKYVYADIRKNGRVHDYVDSLLAYNGDPATLSQNMKDCFTLYDYDHLAFPLYTLAYTESCTWLRNMLLDTFDRKTVGMMAAAYRVNPSDLLASDATAALTFRKGFLDDAKNDFAGYLAAVNASGSILDDDETAADTGALDDAHAAYVAYEAKIFDVLYDVMTTLMQAGAEDHTISMASLTASMGNLRDVAIPAFQAEINGALAGLRADPENYDYTLNENFYSKLATDAGWDYDALMDAVCMYVRTSIGNSFYSHPSPKGHRQIADAVLTALNEDVTGDDVVEEEVKIALSELYNLVQKYGPEVAAQVWAQWEEYGYVDAVETSLSELKGMLSARYTYYTETALPAINDSVSALTAQKDALTVELGKLNAELAAKKAELAEVIANVEIGSIHTPDINIDVELGNNQQTDVPENDCTVDGEDIKAELEAAVKDLEHAIAVIEALIADIEADIADMIALAEQIAAAVAELEKTMTDVAAAAEELEKAINDVINVVKNSEGVVNQVVNSFEAARDTANAAVKVLTLTIGTAEEMMADVDTMIEKIAADAEALYNKFMTELPGCIEQIPEEAMMLIGGSALLIQQTYEANKEAIDAALKAELAALAEEYGISEQAILAELAKLEQEYADDEAALKAELAAIEAKIAEEVNAKYAEIKADYDAQIEAAKAEAAVKLAALEAELKGYEAELNALAADAAQDVIDGIQAQIDRVNADIATVNEDLACAIEHLENADQIAYEQIVAEVTKVYEETIADLNEKLAELEMAYNEAVAALNEKVAELKAAYDKAVEDLTAVADQAIADLTEELNKTLEELNKALSDKVNGILSAIRGELVDVQKSVEEILKGNLVAVEGLKDALLEMSGDAIVDACEALIDVVMALIEEATTADLVIDDDFKYVAIGDGSAATESYVEKLTAALNAEAAENGVDEIEVVNNAYVGNTVVAERENLSDVTDADLITVGFSNVEFLNAAINNALNGVEMDWAAVVGAENVHYVEELLAEVALKIAEAGIEGEYADMANAVIESYAYSAVLYATELPQLIAEINAVNPDALVIIVGMYNPMDDVVIALDENVTMDIGEYIDYLVDGVAVHGIAYSILSGNSIYVDAPDVQTVNTDTELGIFDLMLMIMNGFDTLHPSATGDDYIAAEIADALNITYVKSEPTGLLGDADGNGVVNTKDAKLIQQYYIHAITENDLDLSVCDVDGNGVINTKDAKLVQQYYIHAISSFPVENV